MPMTSRVFWGMGTFFYEPPSNNNNIKQNQHKRLRGVAYSRRYRAVVQQSFIRSFKQLSYFQTGIITECTTQAKEMVRRRQPSRRSIINCLAVRKLQGTWQGLRAARLKM